MEFNGFVQSIAIPIAVSAVGVAFCVGVLYLRRIGRELRTKGVTARATVVRKLQRDGDALENFYAVVSFVDRQHRPHQVEVKVASRVWRGLGEGENTAITYLPDHPETAGLGPVWGRKLVGAILLYLALVGAVVAILGLALPLWDLLQKSEVADSGAEFLILGLFAAGFPALFLLSRRQSARQRAALREFAGTRGWTYFGGDAAELLPLLKAFGPEEVWQAHNVVRAEGHSDRLYLFGYRSRARAGRGSASNGFACLAEGGRSGNDDVVIVYPRVPVVHKLMGDKVEVGGPDFLRQFVVQCRRRDVAEAAVTDTVQRILLEHAAGPGWVVEVRIGNPGVVVISSHAAGPAEWDHLVQLAQRIRAG